MAYNDSKSDRLRYFHGLKNLIGYTANKPNEKCKVSTKFTKLSSGWKDILWLGLKAWHNGRTMSDHDKWIVQTRQTTVCEILQKVEQYRFQNSNSDDDGIVFDEKNDLEYNFLYCDIEEMKFDDILHALQQVNEIMEQMSFAEELYSCTSVFGMDYPVYISPAFNEKLNMLHYWYNTTIELQQSLSSILRLLQLVEYEEVDYREEFYTNESGEDEVMEEEVEDSASEDSEDFPPKISFKKINNAIVVVTDILLRDRKVSTILQQLLNRFSGSLIKAFNLTITKDNAANHSNNNPCAKEVFTYMQTCLPNSKLSADSFVPYLVSDSYGLPSLSGPTTFILDIILCIMSQCLTVRLKQAVECHQHCCSSTSLLTIKQVVEECKEVIQCSIMILSFHSFLTRTFQIDVNKRLQGETMITSFRNNLREMFKTYMNFVNRWVIAQLTGFPTVPRGFIDMLDKEWTFSKTVSFDCCLKCSTLCAVKYVEICTNVFISTKEFMDSACSAVQDPETENEFFMAEQMNKDMEQREEEDERWIRRHSSLSPGSTTAGLLWFHSHHHSEDGSLPKIMVTENGTGSGVSRKYVFALSREVRKLFEEVRERSSRAINFAKELRREYEPAIGFDFKPLGGVQRGKKKQKVPICGKCSFSEKLESHGFVKVEFNLENNEEKIPPNGFHLLTHSIFVSAKLLEASNDSTRSEDEIFHHILSTICKARKLEINCEDRKSQSFGDLVIFVNFQNLQCNLKKENNKKKNRCNSNLKSSQECGEWCGQTISISKDGLKMVDLVRSNLNLNHDMVAVSLSGCDIGFKRNELKKVFSEFIEVTMAQTSINTDVNSSLCSLHSTVFSFCQSLTQQVNEVSEYLYNQVSHHLHGSSQQLLQEINHVVQKNFTIGFECLREGIRLFSGPLRREMGSLHVTYIKHWMEYVIKNLPRGKGRKPKWATTGLDFLVSLDSSFLSEIDNEEYAELKTLINTFVDHLIGTRKCNRQAEEMEQDEPIIFRSLSWTSSKDSFSGPEFSLSDPGQDISNENVDWVVSPMRDIRSTIAGMEAKKDGRKYERGIIGRVVDKKDPCRHPHIQIHSVAFSWQRGTKVGEGAFGQVFTCINLDTSKIIAMKEVHFQPNDEQKVKEAFDEVKTFEGIKHSNLVEYYGVEVHRDQMYIFMEYCDSGNLEEVSSLGLPMYMIQQYTAQITTAVSVLHKNGIIHRDIKGSNIFLTSAGLLKLGDFGSAVRLLDRNKTLPGEIASHVGITAAYSAPEVINSVEAKGYGRAADIWSLGCVVIEMATGKRPWHDDEPFQIMYKVGMGTKPPIPTNLNRDGHLFVDNCIQVDPESRWPINKLLTHPFVKVFNQPIQ